MSSILKRGKNSYRLKYKIGDKTFITTVKCASRPEAEMELAKILLDPNSVKALMPQQKTRDFTLNEWVNMWLDQIAPDITQITFEGYSRLMKHVTRKLGHKTLQNVSASDIRECFKELRNKLSERTLSHVYKTFNSCFAMAVKQTEITRNVLSDVNAPKPKKIKMKVLDEGQLKELVSGLKGNPIQPIVIVGIGTGARLGEILALKWSAIDFKSGTLSISSSVKVTKRDGVTIGDPKNESSKRTLHIPGELIELFKGIKQTSSELIFPSLTDPSKPQRPDNISNQFTRQARKLGFKDVTFHGLRHAFCSHQISEGTPLPVIAEIAGHANPHVTASIYLHATPKGTEQSKIVSGKLLAGLNVGRA